MSRPSDDAAAHRHLAACRRFTAAVVAADGRWDRPSPCTDWNARAVVEHVIGFHDVLLLRPMGAKPDRPRDDPARRWSLTVDALARVFEQPGLFDGPVDVPAVGARPATVVDARALVPMLTVEVLVHTWDLARAVGAPDDLDPQLCGRALARLPADDAALARSGMYEPPVLASDGADAQTRLLAALGRDPSWRA